MPRSRLQVLAAVPGSRVLGPIVTKFCDDCRRDGLDGIITAFSDAALPVARAFADEDCAEVVPFGEVVRRYLVLCGEEALAIAQGGHVRAAIARACGDLSEDSPFARTSEFAGLHRALANTLGELAEWGIDRSELRRLIPLAGPRLSAKLNSLAEIDLFIEDVLRRLRAQSHPAQMRACLEAMPDFDGAQPRLLVFAGAEDSPLKLDWLAWAADVGSSVTVVVERHATDGHIFAGAHRAAARLRAEPTVVGDGNRLMRNLFAPLLSDGESVAAEIQSAVDPLAECEWALRDCAAQGGAGQAAIYARDLELYAPLLEAAGRRLGVPVTIARRAPLLTNSFARLTLAALEFCASRDVRTLGTILPSSYLGLRGEQQELIRSALREAYRTRHSQWDVLRKWAEGHVEDAPWLRELLEWRVRASANWTLREWKALLSELIRPDERFPWSLRVMDDPVMSDRDRYARNQLERLLANHITVEDMFDSATYSLNAMVARCRRIWQDAEVTIPAIEGGIRVADDPYQLTEVPVLRVLGLLEGVFPRRRSEEPILTDAERAEISELRPGTPSLPSSHDRAAAERDAFYRVCAVAERRVVFSYPLADESRDNIPASYLNEVKRAIGEAPTRNFGRTQLVPDEAALRRPSDQALGLALTSEREYPGPVSLQSPAAKSIVLPAADASFEPAELRDALRCPFQYAVRYRLRPHVRRAGERWNSLARLPEKASLLTQKGPGGAEAALNQALDAELDLLYSHVPVWEMPLLRAGGRRLIREWLRREIRARELWPKENLRTNVAFGSDGLNANMFGVRLSGRVPAVSRLKGYSVAHLYESGARDAKKLTNVERLYFGLFFLALHERGREGAIELESFRGKRELMLLTRSGGDVAGEVREALSVVDLSTCDDPVQSKRQFFDEVKRLLRIASERIRAGRVDPIQGDHCDVCDYGELCRRSRAFGEEDSPFVEDTVGEGMDDV